MKKIVKKYGDSLVIVFTKEEQRINNIKEGTILDLSDMIVHNLIKKSKGGKK